jgi:superfamily II DNA or RNA helicase
LKPSDMKEPSPLIGELTAVITPHGSIQLEWTDTDEPIGKGSRVLQGEIYRRYEEEPDSWLLYLSFSDQSVSLSPSLHFLRRFSGRFARGLTQTPDLEALRHRVRVEISDEEMTRFLNTAPMMIGADYLDRDFLSFVWEGLHRSFSRAIQSHRGSVEAFFHSFSPNVHLVGRIFFHMVENKTGDLPFAFLATYSTRLNRQGQSRHVPLKYALKEYEADPDKLLDLLATVHMAAKESPLIAELIETGELFHPLAWTTLEAFTFLKEIPIYEKYGILCRIPDWWKGKKPGVQVRVSVGEKAPAHVGLDAILDFKPRLLLGDLEISEEEARRLLDQSEGLAFIKNRWVAVDPERLRKALDAYEKLKHTVDQDGLSLRDALRLELFPEQLSGKSDFDEACAVSRGRWLDSVVQKLRNPALVSDVKPDSRFKAELRPYQQKGINWLHFLHALGFGACLADDMGLGKTVQLLGFLNVIRSSLPAKANLLVIPASLIGNWVGEIERFFPALRYGVAHPDGPPDKVILSGDPSRLDELDLVITTYSQAQKLQWLQDRSWRYVILDEAQAVKNPGAKQTRAIKRLQAENRICMTGTPIENRLSDLWSLFDFLNPGLLGGKTEFGRLSKRLRQDADGYCRLRNVIRPYLLRRLKTDKTVISDLPDKVELKTYAALSKKQVVLYQDHIRQLESLLTDSEGIQRKGLILASLMKLKQLCNHADQYLGTGEYEERDSGKFERLREVCEVIHEKREKALLFTQFKEMTDPLCGFLERVFDRKGLVLHGSTPVRQRKEIIERFQEEERIPFMVLSLKAGGVGLNLTRANHVIHFDRWWNPAVENQATDRAFRIGQNKKVMVHKFITRGTVEEKIDRMLEDKAHLSREVIAESGEAWITEMSNDELMGLFSLVL